VPRRNRVVPDGERWARAFHVIRGNEEEIAHLGGLPGDADAAAGRLLAWGTEEVYVTRAERGATRFARPAALAGPARLDIAAVPCVRPADPTGCGDSFLSALVAGHLSGLPPAAAARLAAFVAAEVLAASGLGALTALRGVRGRAAVALGDAGLGGAWPSSGSA
jgi:sugar/nucleoside kinase (ribokinase family)